MMGASSSTSRGKWKLRTITLVAAACAVIVWILAWFSIVVFSWLAPDDVTRMGQIGDMFGAANALFSGIAVAAVAVVLVFDMNERERDLKDREGELERAKQSLQPFVVARIDPDSTASGVAVGQAQYISDKLNVAVRFNVEFQNLSQDPAINVTFSVQDCSQSRSQVESVLPLPMSAIASQSGQVSLHYEGLEAEEVLGNLIDSGRRFTIVTRYSNLNGIEWISSTIYTIKAPVGNDEIDGPRKSITEALNKGAPIVPSDSMLGSGDVYLIASPVQGSWSHHVVDAES